MKSLQAKCLEREGLSDFKTLTLIFLGPGPRWGMSGLFSLVSFPLNTAIQNRRRKMDFPVMDSVHLLVVSNLTCLLLVQSRMADDLRMYHHHQASVISVMFRQAWRNAYLLMSYFCCWSWSPLLEIVFFVICGRLATPTSCSEDMCQCEHTYIYVQGVFSTYVLHILGKESSVLQSLE